MNSITKDQLKLVDEATECPRCLKYSPELMGFLKQRTSSKGTFLGCSNYPRCHYTVDIQ